VARTGERSLAVELATPAISSPPPFTDGQGRERSAALRIALPHLKFMDGEHRGYVVVDLTPTRMQADWYFIPTVDERSDAETHAAALICERGSSHLSQATAPTAAQPAAVLAPLT
jgi:alkaline phosphatase D